jgi:perosamine synthetase
MQALLDEGISTRRAVMCSHREMPYLSDDAGLLESEWAQDSGVILPLHGAMTIAEVDVVVDALRRALAGRL